MLPFAIQEKHTSPAGSLIAMPPDLWYNLPMRNRVYFGTGKFGRNSLHTKLIFPNPDETMKNDNNIISAETKKALRVPEGSGCYTYMLRCRDGTFYIGWTNNLPRRLEAHNCGKGAKYTRGRGPVQLVYWEEFFSKEEAMAREWQLKQLSRAEKERLSGEGI